MNEGAEHDYVSRGGLKLAAALAEFKIDVNGKTVADLGCSTGGFTDVLLRNGAKTVYAIDTGYGVLDWKLRNDKRVIVMERTNALHVVLPEKVDMAVIDAGWTRQELILPQALSLLKAEGDIVSLVKPHYEAKALGVELKKGKTSTEDSLKILNQIITNLDNTNIRVNAFMQSPILGGKGDNIEYLIWIKIKPNN